MFHLRLANVSSLLGFLVVYIYFVVFVVLVCDISNAKSPHAHSRWYELAGNSYTNNELARRLYYRAHYSTLHHLRHMPVALLKDVTLTAQEVSANEHSSIFAVKNARTIRRHLAGNKRYGPEDDAFTTTTEPFTHRGRHRRFETDTTSATTTLSSPEGDLIASNTTFHETESEVEKERYTRFRDLARFWVQRVLVPILMVIGILGNSVTIAIMTRRRMRSSTNWYLTALATFDMLYLICTFALSLKHYPNAHHADYYWYWRALPWAMMLADTSSNTSVWLTVTFTIERYIAVCHPIKGKAICTESRAKKVCLCVFLVCISVTLPTPFEWEVVESRDAATNATTYSANFSELGTNETYKNIYYHLNVLLFTLIPLKLLTIFNAFLIRSVNLANKQRERMIAANDNYQSPKNDRPSTASVRSLRPSTGNVSPCTQGTTTGSGSHSSRQETRITIMLIFVVILFIVCQTPTACMLIFTAFQQEISASTNNLIIGLGNIFNLLLSINSAGNFVLYCLLSQKYRTTFMTMFCPCLSPNCLSMQTGRSRAGLNPYTYPSRAHQENSSMSVSDRCTMATFEPSADIPLPSSTGAIHTPGYFHLNIRQVHRHGPAMLSPTWHANQPPPPPAPSQLARNGINVSSGKASSSKFSFEPRSHSNSLLTKLNQNKQGVVNDTSKEKSSLNEEEIVLETNEDKCEDNELSASTSPT